MDMFTRRRLLTSTAAGAAAATFGIRPGKAAGKIILSKDYSMYTHDANWWAVNNTWGKSPFVNGRDYTQTIACDRETFPNGTVMAWSWPDAASSSWAYSYPTICYGNNWELSTTTGHVPQQIKNITDTHSVTFDYSLQGNAANSVDVMFETFLTDGKTGQGPFATGNALFELSIIPFPGPGGRRFTPEYTFNLTGFKGSGYVRRASVPQVELMPDSDMFSGTINLREVLTFLMSNGILTGEEYLSTWQFGCEVQSGAPTPHSGGLTFNKLSVVWD